MEIDSYEEVGEDARLVDVAEEGVEDLAGDEGDAELEEDGVVVGRQDAACHRAIHGCSRRDRSAEEQKLTRRNLP